jgi:dienelactone hydrolase
MPTLAQRACRIHALALVLVTTLLAAPTLATTLSNAPDPVPHIALINVDGIGPTAPDIEMQVHIFLPGNAKIDPRNGMARTRSGAHLDALPVLLYAHGRPAYASARAQLKRPIHARHVQYWLSKGYAVVAPIRPGYGVTAVADQESSGVGYSATGQCIRQPTPARLATSAARAPRAALAWVRQQPWARADHIVLEGQSAGGLATVALCATNPPGVRGCINFSGGAGGDPQHAPGNVCAPEKIAALMQQYGSTTRSPSIWLYAPNDLYWGAAAPQQWHAAFNQSAAVAKTTAATLITTPPIGSDGHSLQRAGSAQWSPPLAAWLKKNRL